MDLRKSISVKLIAAFLAVTAVTLMLGIYAEHTLSQTGRLAVETYDKPLMATSYARSSALQAERLAEMTAGAAPDADRLEAINDTADLLVSDLEVVVERSFTPDISAASADALKLAESWVKENKAFLDGKSTDLIGGPEKIAQIKERVETLTEHIIAGGFEYREEAEANVAQSQKLLWFAIGLSVLIGLSLGYLMARSIAVPLKDATGALQSLSEGDLEVAFESKSQDEIGALARVIGTFKQSLIERMELRKKSEREAKAQSERSRSIEHSIKQFKDDVAKNLTQIVQQMDQMEATAEALTGVAEETAGKFDSAAQASNQSSERISSVAGAGEQLATSVSEISHEVHKTMEVIEGATVVANSSSEKVSNLATAAQKIGDVVSMISDIAEQTNLLALNATIEAARAGEAGKGFAVVASEVKELATQTSKATEEISQQISSIQGETDDAVEAIHEITEVIAAIKSNSSSIAAAVEEQSASTGEISQNVQEVAAGSTELTKDIDSFKASTDEAAQSAGQMLSASRDVRTTSETLRKVIDGFLEKVAAA